MKERAAQPFYSRRREEWIVGVNCIYAPGETVTTLHSHSSFKSEDEALSFVAATNGQKQ